MRIYQYVLIITDYTVYSVEYLHLVTTSAYFVIFSIYFKQSLALKSAQKISMRFLGNPKLLVDPSDYVESLLSEPNQVFILVSFRQKCRKSYIFNIFSGVDLLHTLYLFLQSDVVQDLAIGNDFKKMGYCRALTLDKLVMTRNNCFLLRKNGPYTAAFDRK